MAPAEPDADTLFQEAVAHLEAKFAQGNKYVHYPFAVGTPAPVIREVFAKIRDHYDPHWIARLDSRPAGVGVAARIYLTKPVRLTMVRGRLTPN
jgi:hypothetical protein